MINGCGGIAGEAQISNHGHPTGIHIWARLWESFECSLLTHSRKRAVSTLVKVFGSMFKTYKKEDSPFAFALNNLIKAAIKRDFN